MILGFLLISHCREPSTDHDHRYHRKFDWCQEGQLHVDAMGNTIGHAVICGIHGWRLLLLQIQVSKLCISRFCPCQNRYKYLVNIVLWIIIVRYQIVFTIILQDDQLSTTSTFFSIIYAHSVQIIHIGWSIFLEWAFVIFLVLFNLIILLFLEYVAVLKIR